MHAAMLALIKGSTAPGHPLSHDQGTQENGNGCTGGQRAHRGEAGRRRRACRAAEEVEGSLGKYLAAVVRLGDAQRVHGLLLLDGLDGAPADSRRRSCA